MLRLLLCSLLSLSLLAQTTGFDSQRLSRINAYIDQAVASKQFAGINAMILHQGKVAYTHSAGLADREANTPMRPDSIFRIHSMTKLIASTAAMILYEDGKFLLDDPVEKYLPQMANLKVLSEENNPDSPLLPAKRLMTVRHLLTHTSGLFNNSAYAKANVFDRNYSLKQMVTKLSQVPLAHQPGEAWRYGQSIDVVGALVEVWSGKTFDVFLEERIFRPLKMTDTAFYVPAGKLKRVAQQYTSGKDGELKLDPPPEHGKKPTYFSGGGGLYSTIGDYSRFLQIFLNQGSFEGQKILSPFTIDFMMRNHVPLDQFPEGGPNNRRAHGFGIGAAVLMDAAQGEVLASDGDFNWGGAAGTYYWVDRKKQLAGLWFVQLPPFTPQPSKRFKVLTYSALQ